MTFIDLSPGKQFIESFMNDQCLITRDPRGILDDVLNTATGELVQPVPLITVYQGKCLAKTLAPRQRPPEFIADQGEKEFKLLRLMLPLTVTNIQQGDIFRITQSLNDPRLMALTYRVIDVNDATQATYRALIGEEYTYEILPED